MQDVSGLPPVPVGGPGVPPLHAAAGVGYGEGFAGNSHRYAPAGLLAAVKYLVEETGADVNAVDHEGNTPLHHAAARGDNEMISTSVSKGADVRRVNREGQTTADMANGPVQRTQPFPEAIEAARKPRREEQPQVRVLLTRCVKAEGTRQKAERRSRCPPAFFACALILPCAFCLWPDGRDGGIGRSAQATLVIVGILFSGSGSAFAQGRHAVLDLWTAGKPAFGVFVPNENPQRFERGQPPPKGIYTKEGGEKLAANPLLDFVFLNLEGSYDLEAVKAIAAGLKSGAGARKTLLVRIPTIERDGVEATRTRVRKCWRPAPTA